VSSSTIAQSRPFHPSGWLRFIRHLIHGSKKGTGKPVAGVVEYRWIRGSQIKEKPASACLFESLFTKIESRPLLFWQGTLAYLLIGPAVGYSYHTSALAFITITALSRFHRQKTGI
jgi:hypothetical protein